LTRAKPTLSVIVPALNEERHLATAVDEVIHAIGDRFDDWEILLFDDGSSDSTGRIADQLARAEPRIRVTHNPRPRNLGGVYKQGVGMARFEYVVMIPGDNENPASAMIPVFDAIGKAEIVLPYPENNHARSALRVFISKSYVALLNALFSLDLPYYNGTVVHRVENARRFPLTDSFAYQSELLIELLRDGASHVAVPIRIAPRQGRRSKALRPGNVAGVLSSLASLFYRVRVAQNRVRP
jgi:glycosyltransferase involved in cell wall biosynthesis